jgi:hypothetical protein
MERNLLLPLFPAVGSCMVLWAGLGGFPTPKTQRRRASYDCTQLMCPAPPVTGDGEIRSASREKQLTNFAGKVE